ncbi:hypothetical protein ABGB18_11190 [Nonomuraea sp. B12E4]|uniref:hypothetical protein n=1 Tax=Nonomuraea sp. B12E4 TaxID=3153564 RepID=UPI00325D992A
MSIKPIETWYGGCRFRSRLEARYAVLFDHAGVRWEYEPQGFVINGRPYLPDFLLPDCGTWVEVKGSEEDLDQTLMRDAALELPDRNTTGEHQPRLLLLGPVPEPSDNGDWGWLGLAPEEVGPGETEVFGDWWGLGAFRATRRLARLTETSSATPDQYEEGAWLTPAHDATVRGVSDAYRAARSARFEHGESG